MEPSGLAEPYASLLAKLSDWHELVEIELSIERHEFCRVILSDLKLQIEQRATLVVLQAKQAR